MTLFTGDNTSNLNFLVEVMSLPEVTPHQLLIKCDFTSTNTRCSRRNVIYLYLVEVKAVLPMILLLKVLKHPIFNRGIVALLDLVEVMTPPLIVEVKALRSKSVSKYWHCTPISSDNQDIYCPKHSHFLNNTNFFYLECLLVLILFFIKQHFTLLTPMFLER